MKRDFGNLTSQGSAAAANSGSLMNAGKTNQVLLLDPDKEIYYDPTKNVRNKKTISKESLVNLRLSMDKSEQLQSIRVYPLPADDLKRLGYKKDETIYGIAFGHRRVLACRLTSKDDPRIGDRPRKVLCVNDPKWVSRPESEKIQSQADENISREPLNFVEEGEMIRNWREVRSAETGKAIPQTKLMEQFQKKEKTIYYLLQAAEFDELAKDACHLRILTDLDSLATFDTIVKTNSVFAQTVYDSLQDPEAPRTRSLIRAAKTYIENNPEYVPDSKTWKWPETVLEGGAKSGSIQVSKTNHETDASPGGDVGVNDHKRSPSNSSTNSQNEPKSKVHSDDNGPVDIQYPPESQQQSVEPRSQASTNITSDASQGKPARETAINPGISLPTLMVSFKMAKEAELSFTGQLMLDKTAKVQTSAVVAYLNEGVEEEIDVPLKFITLLSINR